MASGDGGPGDSFEDLETSRIARIPRGLRVSCGLGSVEPGNFSHTSVPAGAASRRALGALDGDNGTRLGFRSLFLSRAPLSEEAREEP